MLSLTREYAEDDFDEYTAPEPVKSNALSKCPVFPANAFFLQPLHVDQIDAVEVTRLHACRAQKVSHSAINIRVPKPRRAEAQSMPYLHTNVCPMNLE